MTAKDTLGHTFRDRVTGFSGIATAFCSYLTGCDQVCLQPAQKDDGTVPDARWFDVTRIDSTGAAPVVIAHTPETAGADASVLRAPGMRL